MHRYREVRRVGAGSFGTATLATCAGTTDQVVIKKIDIRELSEEERRGARREANLLSNLRHPNIIAHIESFEEDGYLCIVTEFAERGDLAARLAERRGVWLAEDAVMEHFVQIGLALLYLHRKKVLHRDLKLANVFLTADNAIKLGDFGIARVLKHTMECAKTVVGTPYYLSPEICESKPYNHKSDVWSLGCVLYELCAQKHAFEGSSITALVRRILRGRYDPLPSIYSEALHLLVASMLQLKAGSRPSVAQVLSSPACKPHVMKYVAALARKGVHVPHLELLETVAPIPSVLPGVAGAAGGAGVEALPQLRHHAAPGPGLLAGVGLKAAAMLPAGSGGGNGAVMVAGPGLPPRRPSPSPAVELNGKAGVPSPAPPTTAAPSCTPRPTTTAPPPPQPFLSGGNMGGGNGRASAPVPSRPTSRPPSPDVGAVGGPLHHMPPPGGVTPRVAMLQHATPQPSVPGMPVRALPVQSTPPHTSSAVTSTPPPMMLPPGCFAPTEAATPATVSRVVVVRPMTSVAHVPGSHGGGGAPLPPHISLVPPPATVSEDAHVVWRGRNMGTGPVAYPTVAPSARVPGPAGRTDGTPIPTASKPTFHASILRDANFVPPSHYLVDAVAEVHHGDDATAQVPASDHHASDAAVGPVKVGASDLSTSPPPTSIPSPPHPRGWVVEHWRAILIHECTLPVFRAWYVAAVAQLAGEPVGLGRAGCDGEGDPPAARDAGSDVALPPGATDGGSGPMWERWLKVVEGAAPRGAPVHKFIKGWSDGDVGTSHPTTGPSRGGVVLPLLTGMVKLLMEERRVYGNGGGLGGKSGAMLPPATA